MQQPITPVTLPPQFAFMQMCMATWSEAMKAGTTEILQWWCMPFFAPPHHHEHERFQLEMPDPIEDEGEHDLFA